MDTQKLVSEKPELWVFRKTMTATCLLLLLTMVNQGRQLGQRALACPTQG
jgi:hypothetical protein